MRNGHHKPDSIDPRLGATALKGYLRLYETQLKSERKASKTLQAYFYVLGKFTHWLEEDLRRPLVLGDVTVTQARSFLVTAQEKTRWDGHPFIDGRDKGVIAGATVHHYVRTLKTFGAWLEREGYVEDNPLWVLKLPKVEEKQLVPLSEEEERLLIETYDDNNPNDCRSKAIFLLMLDTGLRLAEVTGLLEQNVDFERGFVLVMGKGRKERSVPFGYTTEKVLRKYVAFFRAQPDNPTIKEFFLSPDGYPLSPKALQMVFTRARKRTGIRRLHAHLLRHTYGIRAQENDMSTITLQHYMGHTSSKVTERYAHAAQSEKLKRARGFSPIDQLGLRVKPMGKRKR